MVARTAEALIERGLSVLNRMRNENAAAIRNPGAIRRKTARTTVDFGINRLGTSASHAPTNVDVQLTIRRRVDRLFGPRIAARPQRAIRRPAARTSNTSPRFLAIELDVRGKPTPWLDGRNDCDAPRADWRRSRHSPRMLLVQSKDLRTRAVPFARRARRHQDSMGEKGSSLCEDSCSYLPTNNERTAGHWAI